MKVINLNESQYKRLFEVSQGVLSYGQDNPPSIPEYKNQEEIGDDAKLHGDDGNVKNQKAFGGITKGKETNGKFVGKDLGDVVSRASTFNMGGVRGGTGGF